MDYLAPRLERDEQRLRITWKNAPLHLDDQVWPEGDDNRTKPGEIEIRVKPSALLVLQP